MKEAEPIQSPCINRCCLDDNDICLGCFRALHEITGWSNADNSDRLTILKNADIRRECYKNFQNE